MPMPKMKLRRFKLGKRNLIALVALALFLLVASLWIYKPRRSPEITFLSAEQTAHRIYMKFRVKNRSMLPIWVEVDGEDIPTLQLVSEKNQFPLPSAYLGREAQPLTFVRAATRRRISGNSAREIDISIHVEDGNVPFLANLRWSPSSSPSETIGKKISAMFPRIGSRKSPVERLRSHFHGAGAIRTVLTEEYSEAFE